jgi:cytochrome P450
VDFLILLTVSGTEAEKPLSTVTAYYLYLHPEVAFYRNTLDKTRWTPEWLRPPLAVTADTKGKA